MKTASAFMKLIGPLLITAAISLVYFESLDYPYIFDDSQNFVENPGVYSINYMYRDFEKMLDDKHFIKEFYHHFRIRALPYLSFWANFQIAGLVHPWKWRIVNIALHCVMSSLVLYFVISLFNTPRLKGLWPLEHVRVVSLATGLIYALHPLMTETVVYISGRVGQIAAVLYMGSLLAYMGWRARGSGWRLSLSLALGLMAMFSKETAFTLPLMVVLVEWMFYEEGGWPKWRRTVPHLCLLPVIPLAKIVVLIKSRWTDLHAITNAMEEGSRLLSDIPRQQYLYTQFTVLVRYIRLMFAPTGQNVVYDWPLVTSMAEPRALLSLAALTALFALGVRMMRESSARPEFRIMALGVFAFFLTLSVESSVFPIVMLIAEYRTYLPMAFVVPAVVVCGVTFLRRPGLPAFRSVERFINVAAVAVVALGVATMLRLPVWHSHLAFWSDTAKKSPNSFIAHYNLGIYYKRVDRFDNAEASYMRAIEISPGSVTARLNLANLYSDMGKDNLAEPLYRGLVKDANLPLALLDYGRFLHKRGRLDEAIGYYRKSAGLAPSAFDPQLLLAEALYEKGSYPEALNVVKDLLTRYPDAPSAYALTGEIYTSLGKPEEAVSVFDRLLTADPSYFNALIGKARALILMRRYSEALMELKPAYRLDPDNEEILKLADQAREGLGIRSRLGHRY